MGTRKNHKFKKSNKRFRKTRSKRQCGGIINDNNIKLIKSSMFGNTEKVKMLLKHPGIDVNAKDNDGYTALYWASQNGRTEIVAMLLDAGADVNAKDNNGWTALIRASQKGHTEIVSMLLEKGADVNAKNNNGWTALTKAIWNEHPEIVGMLLENGADVNVTVYDGWTALVLAIEKRDTEIVAMLLENGADVNATDNNGDTALMKVINCDEEDDRPWNHVENDIIEIVEMLLEKGADVNVENNNGWTALKIAKETGCTEKIQKPIIKHKIAQTIPKVLERQQERKNLAMVMSEKDVGNRGDGKMPYELRYEIEKYLGGGKRKTRKTRSKRQRGGVETRSGKDTSKAKKSTRKTKNKPSKKPPHPHTEENNELCPICLEIIDNNTDNVTTNCNHIYHRLCLIELCEGKRNNAICPICRKNIRDICDIINPHPVMDENINANDGINLLDELNAEVENEDDREIYTIFEDDDFIEERNRILNEGNIGDIIEYISNGQLNMRYYEINLDEDGNKYFKEVGDMYGFYNNPEHPDYDLYSDLYNIEGGKRKTRKTRRK